MPEEGGPQGLKELALRHHASTLENPETKRQTIERLSVADLKKVTKHVERRKSIVGFRVPPDGGFGWVVVLSAFLQHVLCCGTLYSILAYFPALMSVFDLPLTIISWICAVFFGCFFMCGPLASYLVQKWGTKATAFAGCLTSACGLIVASFMNSFYLVVLFMAVFGGLGTGCAILAAVTSTVRWFEVKRGLAIGIVATGTSFGSAGFAPLITFLIDKYGWDGCMLIESGLLLNGCILAFFLREVPMRRPKVFPESAGPNMDSKVTSPGPDTPLMKVPDDAPLPPARKKSVAEKAKANVQILRNWKFWVFAIGQFLIFFACNAPLVFLLNRGVIDCGLSRMHASYLMTILGISSILARLCFGAIAGKLKTYKIWPFALFMSISGITGMVVALSTSFVPMALYSGTFGIAYGTMISLTSLVLVDYFGVSQIASAYGNLAFFRGLGFLAGPPVGGLIVSYTGGLHNILFFSMGVVMTIGGFIICLVPVVEKLLSLKRRGR